MKKEWVLEFRNPYSGESSVKWQYRKIARETIEDGWRSWFSPTNFNRVATYSVVIQQYQKVRGSGWEFRLYHLTTGNTIPADLL